MKYRRIARSVIAAVLVALAAAGCSGGSSGSTGTNKSLTHVSVGVLPIVNDAPLYVAIRQGLFKAQGLEVTPVLLANGALSTEDVQSGKLQFAYSNYVTTILAASTGAPLRVVADAAQDQAGATVIMVPKGSPITSVQDLRGKTVAVNALRNIGPLMVDSTLQAFGVPLNSVKLTVVPFPQMAAALKHHAVDATWTTEPFVTQSEEQIGAQQLADTATGAMANFPIGGYETSTRYAQQNLAVVTAFERAIEQAQRLAVNRAMVEQVLPAYIKGMTPQLIAAVHFDNYPITLSVTRLQRVASAMFNAGLLKQQFQASQLVLNS